MGKHFSTKAAKSEALKDINKSLQENQVNYIRREKQIFNMLKYTKQQNIDISALEHTEKLVLASRNH